METRNTIAFPASARIAEIRKAANLLTQMHGVAATIYWKRLVLGIAEGMLAAGIHEETVQAEVVSFQHAVLNEVQMIGFRKQLANR